MKKIKKISLIMVTVMIGLLFIMCTARIAEAREKVIQPFDTRVYREQVGELLEEYGLYHSGITMTHIVEESQYTYEMQIHHKKIAHLSKAQQEALIHKSQSIFAKTSDDTIEIIFI